jgi:hypothetical protein
MFTETIYELCANGGFVPFVRLDDPIPAEEGKPSLLPLRLRDYRQVISDFEAEVLKECACGSRKTGIPNKEIIEGSTSKSRG